MMNKQKVSLKKCLELMEKIEVISLFNTQYDIDKIKELENSVNKILNDILENALENPNNDDVYEDEITESFDEVLSEALKSVTLYEVIKNGKEIKSKEVVVSGKNEKISVYHYSNNYFIITQYKNKCVQFSKITL